MQTIFHLATSPAGFFVRGKDQTESNSLKEARLPQPRSIFRLKTYSQYMHAGHTYTPCICTCPDTQITDRTLTETQTAPAVSSCLPLWAGWRSASGGVHVCPYGQGGSLQQPGSDTHGSTAEYAKVNYSSHSIFRLNNYLWGFCYLLRYMSHLKLYTLKLIASGKPPASVLCYYLWH